MSGREANLTSSQKPQDVLRLSYGVDPNQFADVRIPDGEGPYPVVFFIHGGYWRAKYDLTTLSDACVALRGVGIATWNVEYRRVGQAGGGWPRTFEDVRAAFHQLHEKAETLNLDLTRLCVAGHSAGGQLALCLAAHDKSITRVVSLAGVLDLRRAWELHLSNDAVIEFLGGSPEQVPGRYRQASPAEQSIAAGQMLVHGTADTSVPYEISQGYRQRKHEAGEEVQLLSLPGVDHMEIVDPESAVWGTVMSIFTSLLIR